MGSSCCVPARKQDRDGSVIERKKPAEISLIEAAAQGDVAKLAMLIGRGVSIDCCDRECRSALHLACAEGHADTVRFLIASGAKPNAKDRWGNEPLREAMLNGHKEVVAVLLKSSAEVSDNLKSEMEMKLRNFVSCGDLQSIKNLAECGISVHSADYMGRTTLHLASEKGHLHVVEYLISQGVSTDTLDSLGENALSAASKNNHFAIQNALLRAGATFSKERICFPKSHGSKKASFAIMEAFARPIATATLEGKQIPTICKSSVSIFFSDIVGFTSISSGMSASSVSRMLNSLFTQFDRLAYVHGVQKIDVIGDAYIAATNFTEDQSTDHAARLARFAIDAMAAARATPVDEDDPDPGRRCLDLRVGMHCGPVSGAVIGQTVLKYTLIGETVNIASAMESRGVAGRIQCSETSAALIASQADDIMLRPRDGGVRLDGRSTPMATFWVTRLREGWRRYDSCPNCLRGIDTAALTAFSAGGDTPTRCASFGARRTGAARGGARGAVGGECASSGAGAGGAGAAPSLSAGLGENGEKGTGAGGGGEGKPAAEGSANNVYYRAVCGETAGIDGRDDPDFAFMFSGIPAAAEVGARAGDAAAEAAAAAAASAAAAGAAAVADTEAAAAAAAAAAQR